MARNSLLDRFRPVGAPGPAGPAGVPAGDSQGPEAELVPVFDSLDPTITQAQELIEDAKLRAEETVRQARERAAAEVEQARLDSGAVRARAAAQVSSEAEATDAQMLRTAEDEAAELKRRGESRVPELAAAIVADLVQDLLGNTNP
jgi:vacuolar-type H+-ATPase subunit H